MWLYVPQTSFPSVPVAEGLISESDWRAQMLARSVTWNGKHSRSQTWSHRFRRVSWTTLLFGAISPSSMANLGVESLIGSLAESRASHTLQPASAEAIATSETSSQTQPESSERSDPEQSSWRTFQASFGITTSASGQTCEQWVTQLRKDYSRRLRLAHHTLDNGSLSWRTPATTDSEGGTKGVLATRPIKLELRDQSAHWPTPNAGRAKHFPTPSVSDIKGFDGPNKASPSKTYEPYSRLAQFTSTDGHECSPKCRRLNPRFVTWLMGWPPIVIDHTDSDSLEMEWCLWWRLMRSALSCIGRD